MQWKYIWISNQLTNSVTFPVFNWFIIMCKAFPLFIVHHNSISVDDMHIFVYIDWVKKEIPDKYYIPMNNVVIVFLLSYLFMLSPDIISWLPLSHCYSKPTIWMDSLSTINIWCHCRVQNLTMGNPSLLNDGDCWWRKTRLLRDSIQAETDCVKNQDVKTCRGGR